MKLFFKPLLVFVFLTNVLFAKNNPIWFDLALTGSGGGCFLTSKNIFGDSKTVNSSPSFCYSFGGKLGINFNENHEIAFNSEYYFRNQSYDIKLTTIKFNKNLALRGVDLALLYRHRNDESAGYVEIGPQMTLISSAIENREGIISDVGPKFTPNYFSGVFGFGSNLVVSNAFTWTIGFRFTYSFTDMISADGGKGNTTSYPLNDPGASKAYDSYAPFSAATLQLHTEFTFDLGYFAKSKCKRGRISFLRFK